MAVMGQEAIISCFLPMAIARDVTSYRHTEFPVDDVCSVMSPHTSYSGGIKAVTPLSWGFLLPLHKTENLNTPSAS